MADNYLEKRMEDLKSGRLASSNQAYHRNGNAMRRGCLNIPFPERRVLVTDGTHGAGLAIAVAFRKAGCRTAVFDTDKESGAALAHDEGIRFHNADICNEKSLSEALSNLLNAWRDIDVIVLNTRRLKDDCEAVSIICDKLGEWRKKLPFGNPFGGRIILISSEERDFSKNITETLGNYNFTVNSIVLKSGEEQYSENLARLCLFLCAPGNEFLDGVSIPVK